MTSCSRHRGRHSHHARSAAPASAARGVLKTHEIAGSRCVECMDRVTAKKEGEPTAERNFVCSGLRNRMDAACNSDVHVLDASVNNSSKVDASPSPSSTALPADDHPDLTGERGRFMLLVTLYALQGSLLGLASGTLPFIIQACGFGSEFLYSFDYVAGKADFLFSSRFVQICNVAVRYQVAVVAGR